MATTTIELERLGKSVKAYRLQKNLKQLDLADKAGTSLSTIKKIESGQGCGLDIFIDVLRALSRLHDLEFVLPEIKLKPTERLELERKLKPRRQRASSRT